MTEREKRIEEMARDMCNRKMTCEECVGVHGDIYFRDKSDCKYCFAATRAFNAGYRKIVPNVDFVLRAGDISSIIESARKEAVKEVIEKTVFPIMREKYSTSVKVEFIKTAIFKLFGVEVDE